MYRVEPNDSMSCPRTGKQTSPGEEQCCAAPFDTIDVHPDPDPKHSAKSPTMHMLTLTLTCRFELLQVLTASHEEGAQGPLIKEIKDVAPKAYAARVLSALIHANTFPAARSSIPVRSVMSTA